MPARLTISKIKKGHAEDGSEVGSGQEYGSEKGQGLHGCTIVLGGVGDVLLLLGDL